MKENISEKKILLKEQEFFYQSLTDIEEERLRKNIFRSDVEKFRLFTRMLRTNTLLKKAVITHK